MSDARVGRIAAKLQKLEAEAQQQRITLADALQQLEQKRAVGWMVDTAQLAGRFVATPGIRWLVFGALLRGIKRRRGA